MVNSTKWYENIVVTPCDNSEVEITGAFPLLAVAHYHAKALAKLGNNIKVPGFRKGHVPSAIVVQRIGEQAIVHEAAEIALSENYPSIVAEQRLAVVGQPQIVLTKLAAGNPIEFKITTAVMPEVFLPDYKMLAEDVFKEKTDESIDVSDTDVDNVILQLRENKWRIDHKDADTKKKPDESELPELTLALIKTLGDFVSLDDFRAKIKESIVFDKKRKAQEKRRAAIGEKLIEETKVSLPRIFVESELEKMLAQFRHDVAALGMPFDEYLKKLNKTENDLRNEWKRDAEKRATLQLAFNALAEKENITVAEEEIKKQTEHILTHHKEAKEENVRVYVTTLLKNERVFRFLEDHGHEPD